LKVAVKTLHTKQLSPHERESFLNEAVTMFKLKCDQLLMLYGVCLEPDATCLVMKYASGGSLYSQLYSKAPLASSLCLQWALDIAHGLVFLHAHRPQAILHRDLKSGNVLISEHNRAVICDFGFALVKRATSTSGSASKGLFLVCFCRCAWHEWLKGWFLLGSCAAIVGTKHWMAPESCH